MQVNSAGSTENIMTHGWVLAFGNPAQNPAGWAMSRPKPGPARPSNKPTGWSLAGVGSSRVPHRQ